MTTSTKPSLEERIEQLEDALYIANERIQNLEQVVSNMRENAKYFPELIKELALSNKKIMDRVNMWPYVKIK